MKLFLESNSTDDDSYSYLFSKDQRELFASQINSEILGKYIANVSRAFRF